MEISKDISKVVGNTYMKYCDHIDVNLDKYTITCYKEYSEHIRNYEKCLDNMLSNDIDLCKLVFYWKDWKCDCHKHRST